MGSLRCTESIPEMLDLLGTRLVGLTLEVCGCV
jgi:hypothetical protein